MSTISKDIFKAYDIRGIVDKNLTVDAVRAIGQALGLQARAQGGTTCVVGRDGRLSGPALRDALVAGITAAGIDVIDIGVVATPMVYWAAVELSAGGKSVGSGVMITGSHNPPEYNGLKMVVAGTAIWGETIQALRQTIEAGLPPAVAAPGKVTMHDVTEAYIARIASDVKPAAKLKIAVDCGNGSPGAVAPKLFRALGCEVDELFCEVDGRFPNHHPDPAHPENLEDLIKHLQSSDCEIGFAFDGDGDRLGVVTKNGAIIWPDRQMMLYARDVLSRNPGAEIIFDVKCSRLLGREIERAGGKPLMWKTGHSLVKAKLKETGAPLAGEMSGHIFFKERWYGFDDGMYTGARLLEILAKAKAAGQDISALLEGLPNSSSTPELQLKCAEGEPHAVIEKLAATGQFEGAERIISIDGVRAEWADGFGLARASNTTPVIVLRFEADTPEALARIQGAFRSQLLGVKPDAVLPF
ncbi:MAG TPA: phosphomannomutase/phosphoglucomutase [Burkholderiaceae bacterium]|nr:phosphomannomutase/phosphoglucomutase [Burkholderiaceae bacterium]